MSQQYTSMSKVCATCKYWNGRRELKQYGDYVELNSPMDKGACYSKDSGWLNSSPVQASSGCRCWEKWDALR